MTVGEYITPEQFGIPHKEWRPYQLETIQSILKNSDTRVHIMQAATGFGKSGVCAALGSNGKFVTALTKTIALQEQYKEYDFKILKGMGNYPCALTPILWADSCAHIDDMYKCPVHDQCRYLIAREIYRNAPRRSLNYNYFTLAGWLREYQTHWLVGDEAHRIPEVLTEYLTLHMTRQDCFDLDIPIFPHKFSIKAPAIRMKLALDWITKCMVNLRNDIERLSVIREKNPKVVRRINHIQAVITKFNNALIGAEEYPEDWYCVWSDEGITITPLAVDNYFEPVFMDGFGHNILLMSATIGNFDTFASSIGITNFFKHDIPSVFPPEERPVYLMEDCPAMNHRSTNLEKNKQADCIARVFHECDPSWSGIIHVKSRAKKKELGNRLASRGLQDRLVDIDDGKTTGDKLDNLLRAKEKKGNPIVISYSLEEGADLGDFEICLSADIPFPYIGDELGRVRMNRNRDLYAWQAGITLVQRLGRTRRGRKSDYGDNGFVGIADNSVRIIESQLSDDFKACIVPWK